MAANPIRLIAPARLPRIKIGMLLVAIAPPLGKISAPKHNAFTLLCMKSRIGIRRESGCGIIGRPFIPFTVGANYTGRRNQRVDRGTATPFSGPDLGYDAIFSELVPAPADR